MKTPGLMLKEYDDNVQIMVDAICAVIETYLNNRVHQLKAMQTIRYELDNGVQGDFDDAFVDNFCSAKKYVIKGIIKVYEEWDWEVWETIETGSIVLHFATTEILEHQKQVAETQTAL